MGRRGERHHVGENPAQEAVQHRSPLSQLQLLPRLLVSPRRGGGCVFCRKELVEEMREEGGVGGEGELRFSEVVKEIEDGCGRVGGVG